VKKTIKSCTVVLVSIMLLSLSAVVFAEEPTVPLYTVEDFFTAAQAQSFDLMPCGERLMFLSPVNGVNNIFTRDIVTGVDTQITFETEQSVAMAFAVGDNIIFVRGNLGDENLNIFRVEPFGPIINFGGITNLTPFENATFIVRDTLDGTHPTYEILVISNQETPTEFNMYILNIQTGELTLAYRSANQLHFDNDGVGRILATPDMLTGNTILMHRYTNEGEFAYAKTISHHDDFSVFGFNYTNEYIYVITNINRNFSALARLNPSTMEVVEYVFEHNSVDVITATVGFLTPGVLEYVLYIDDFSTRVFFCPLAQEIHTTIADFFPANTIIFPTAHSQDQNTFLVNIASDVFDMQQFIFNKYENTIEPLTVSTLPPSEHMANMLPVRYTARDGVEIQGFLTLPVGVEPYNLPAVVLVHGGPWARDFWGFHAEVQFLANRGYAVLQPNFRGSTGFGREFLELSFGEWGLSMQDDITDGALWLIEQGIADPDRIAIMGHSWGGYATLAGITFTPDIFAAAIAEMPISSIFTLIDSIPPQWEQDREMFYARIGHPVYDYNRLRAASPVYHAYRATTPLLIAHGANDPRTTLIESVQFVQALENSGIDSHFMVFWDEGHILTNQQNFFQFYAMVEAFLAYHLGGRTVNELTDLDYAQTLAEVLTRMP